MKTNKKKGGSLGSVPNRYCGPFLRRTRKPFLAHLTRRVMWAIAITWRPSSSVVNFSHFNLLLWNHMTDWKQTWQECSLDGPLQSLYFWCRSEIQHGRQGQLCVLIGWNFNNLLVRNHMVDRTVMLSQCFLHGPLSSLYFWCRSEIQDGRHRGTKLT